MPPLPDSLHALHALTGLPWSASLPLLTLSFRASLLPLTLLQRSAVAKLRDPTAGARLRRLGELVRAEVERLRRGVEADESRRRERERLVEENVRVVEEAKRRAAAASASTSSSSSSSSSSSPSTTTTATASTTPRSAPKLPPKTPPPPTDKPTQVPLTQLARIARAYGRGTIAVWRAAGVRPARIVLPPLLQIGAFAAYVSGVRALVATDAAVEWGLNTGGVAWFTDLTVPDDTLILPAVAIAATVSNLELAFRRPPNAPKTESPMDKPLYLIKTTMQTLVLFSAPFVIDLPAAVFLYWLPSSAYSAGLTLALRKWDSLPPRPPPPLPPLPPPASPIPPNPTSTTTPTPTSTSTTQSST